ncbi:hypothetical protein GOP47_0029420 [Adiantum capillus-veneris]|nr:hypothetical protein GOP47_0029420 [Adiantum capillus-veneris]
MWKIPIQRGTPISSYKFCVSSRREGQVKRSSLESIKGLGRTEPNLDHSKVLHDGAIVPLAKPMKKNEEQRGTHLCNEYIVYNTAQSFE